MIFTNNMKALSESNPTDVWCLDTVEGYSIRFDRLSLCSQIKAIPIEDVVAMLEELKEQLREMHEDFFETDHVDEAYGVSNSMDIIQEKIDALNSTNERSEDVRESDNSNNV